ncbi:MAG: UDP-3-O-(3-hydroxymyristoyl)glucosamine N-acyltransferase [Flavobacteriales bacterium]|nr:MAG: UDP-3-O-(3-hydroxymyristoyl)glucosamine N-acyltransferase [Flavobacteriales bacterium]
MKFSQPQTLKSIAIIIDAEFVGEDNFPITGLNEIHVVEQGDLVFVDHQKYYEKALKSKATSVLINKKVDCPEGKALIISNDPFRDFNKLIQHFSSFKKNEKTISESAEISNSTIVQPNVFIGNNVKIGSNCIIHSNVSIYDNTIIGDNVIIHANTIIGSDAFYYKKRAEGYDKLLSCGKVIVEDDVEIGANCTIDRGVTGETVIGKGSKLDNLVHVGHDTVIGKNCLFAAQVGIAGVVKIEDDVTLWGQVGVSSDITIGKGAVVLAQSGISKSLEGNITYFGSPAEEARKKWKEAAAIRKLPEIVKKLDEI